MHARSRFDGREPTRRRSGWFRAAALAALLATGAAACGSDEPSSSPSDAPDPTGAAADEPVDGGTLTYLSPLDTVGFDPVLVSANNSTFSLRNQAVYDALVLEATDGTLHHRLLESGETTDGTTWTLHLREGVEFSDGTPFDAEAVKFNWERLSDPALASPAAPVAAGLESIEVVDPLTLEVVLKAPNGQFLRTIALNALTYIGSPTAIEADPAGFTAHPVGAGPFLLEEWVQNDRATFVRNPDAWDPPHLDELVIRVVPDEAQRVATYQSGDGEIMLSVDARVAASTIQLPNTRTLRESSMIGGFNIIFNQSRPPFDDVRARRAFALAFDENALGEVLDGTTTPVSNMFPDSSPFHDDDLTPPAPSNEEAQALFDELAEENGGPLQVTFTTLPVWSIQSDWFSAQMANFDNVEVTIESSTATEVIAKYTAGDYQAAFNQATGLDPDAFYNVFHTGGALNFMGFSDPEVDAALELGRQSTDEAERIDAYRTVQERLLDEVPVKFYSQIPVFVYIAEDAVGGIGPDALYGATNNILWNEVWLR